MFGPRRRAVGIGPHAPFSLNKASPQARGLIYAGIASGGGWIDVLRGEPDIVETGLTIRHTNFGPNIKAAGGANSEQITLPVGEFLDEDKPFTICWQAKIDSFVTAFNIIGAWEIANVGGISNPFRSYYSTNSSYKDLTFGNPGNLTHRGAFPSDISITGEEHWGVIAYGGAGDIGDITDFKLWVNSQSLVLSLSGGVGPRTEANSLLNDSGNSNQFSGHMKQFRIYNIEWPEVLAREFYNARSRWDLYRQPDRMAYFVPVAGDTIAHYPFPHRMVT